MMWICGDLKGSLMNLALCAGMIIILGIGHLLEKPINKYIKKRKRGKF